MNTTKILKDNVYGSFFHYVSLSVISMIGLSLYVLADTFFIANGVGSNGLTSLNLVLPVYSFINGTGLMLGMGAATRFSILTGEGKKEQGSTVFTHALIMAAIIGSILTIVGIFFTKNLAILLGANEEVLPLAVEYLRTIMCFSIPFLFNNIIVCFVRNDGNPNLSMAAMLSGSFGNIILDYIFIFPLGLGMFGAAFATGLAPVIGLCISSIHFIKKHHTFSWIKCPLSIKEPKRILSIGLPSFITEFSSGIIMLVFNVTILSLTGNVGVAAYGIIANLALIGVAVFTGIAQGVQPLISVHYGAGNHKELKTLLKCACMLAVVLGTVFYGIGALFPNPIIGVFNRDDIKQLTDIAQEGIPIYFLAFFLMGINIVITTFFASVTMAKESFCISILRGCAAVLPIVFILPKFLGMLGVWLTIPFAEIITLIVSILCLILYYKKQVNR